MKPAAPIRYVMLHLTFIISSLVSIFFTQKLPYFTFYTDKLNVKAKLNKCFIKTLHMQTDHLLRQAGTFLLKSRTGEPNTYGGPQLSRQNHFRHGKIFHSLMAVCNVLWGLTQQGRQRGLERFCWLKFSENIARLTDK